MAETQARATSAFRAQLPRTAIDVLAALDEHKCQDIVVLDMREVSAFTDFMILGTGRSEPHVQALVDAVQERLSASNVKVKHVEGRTEANWVLVDLFDVIVHVFTPETRQFYQLERLWRDAPLLEWAAEDKGGA